MGVSEYEISQRICSILSILGLKYFQQPQLQPIIIQQPIPQTSTYNCLVQVYDPITRIIKNEVMICVNQ